jgi:hypothetical protein
MYNRAVGRPFHLPVPGSLMSYTGNLQLKRKDNNYNGR